MFEVHSTHGISIIGLSGELSRRNIHLFDKVLDLLSKGEQHNIVLNLAELEHLDYSIVERLVGRIIEFQCVGGDLKMASASGYVSSILHAMGIEEDIYPSVEEALLDFADMSAGSGPQ